MKLRKFLSGLGRMSEAAFCMLCGTLKVCCVMVLCGFAVYVHMDGAAPWPLWRLAQELTLSPLGVLLAGGVAALLLEERARR